MKKTVLHHFFAILSLVLLIQPVFAQQRRPISSESPLWLIHIDVWNQADPQKIIDLIPEEIKPYVCLNLSLSCQYDTDRDVYKMPQNAIRTYKSWASVCQANKMWFTCQPASGGHTHLMDDDLEIFEYFYKRYPNFLGWNYAEQFWGFNEPGDESSSTIEERLELFAKLVPMAHKYGGFLTISFCGNIWSHDLNSIGMMKQNKELYEACQKYPDAILWLYKYTTASCFYNNESVTFSPFVSGLSNYYGVRYDNCGWNGALSDLFGENNGKTYPVSAGIGTVMEQTCVNGGAVWDGPELIWTEDFQNLSNTVVDGYTRRNWGTFPGFRNAWLDMFRKIIDGTMYIPSRKEVVENTKIIIINDITTGSSEERNASWAELYDGLYKQTDPFNNNNGYWMDNHCYFKKTGRYRTIPVTIGLNDELAKSIPVQIKKSAYKREWPILNKKIGEFNAQYPEISKGDLFVSRFKNQLVTYTPYTYLNSKTTASAIVPLEYNTCDSINLTWGKLSSGIVREYADHIDFYLNNYRTDTTDMVLDKIVVYGATTEPTFQLTDRVEAVSKTSAEWDAETQQYTLNVWHMGPVDVTVNCSGTATERRTDLAASSPLQLPKQPEDYYGEIIIEAEDMDYKNIKKCVVDPYYSYPDVFGHAGNGFMDMGNDKNGTLRHNLNIENATDYNVTVRYTSPENAGFIAIAVNSTRRMVKCEKTEKNEWKKLSLKFTMKEGENKTTIYNPNGLDIYIDNVTYTPTDIPEEKFLITIREAENGKAIASADSAAEGELVTVNPVPNAGYEFAGWNIIHGNINMSDDNTFTMPDDIVTLQPIFAVSTAINTPTVSDVLPGTQCKEIYDINGIKRNDLGKGLNIIKTANGNIRKIYIK